MPTLQMVKTIAPPVTQEQAGKAPRGINFDKAEAIFIEEEPIVGGSNPRSLPDLSMEHMEGRLKVLDKIQRFVPAAAVTGVPERSFQWERKVKEQPQPGSRKSNPIEVNSPVAESRADDKSEAESVYFNTGIAKDSYIAFGKRILEDAEYEEHQRKRRRRMREHRNDSESSPGSKSSTRSEASGASNYAGTANMLGSFVLSEPTSEQSRTAGDALLGAKSATHADSAKTPLPGKPLLWHEQSFPKQSIYKQFSENSAAKTDGLHWASSRSPEKSLRTSSSFSTSSRTVSGTQDPVPSDGVNMTGTAANYQQPRPSGQQDATRRLVMAAQQAEEPLEAVNLPRRGPSSIHAQWQPKPPTQPIQPQQGITRHAPRLDPGLVDPGVGLPLAPSTAQQPSAHQQHLRAIQPNLSREAGHHHQKPQHALVQDAQPQPYSIQQPAQQLGAMQPLHPRGFEHYGQPLPFQQAPVQPQPYFSLQPAQQLGVMQPVHPRGAAPVQGARSAPQVAPPQQSTDTRPSMANRPITELQKYLRLPEGQYKSFVELPLSQASRLDQALASVYNTSEKNTRVFARITDKAYWQTYISSQKCIAFHIISKGSKRNGGDGIYACPTCSKNPGRPCVRLERLAAGSDAVLVFYPRSPASVPPGSTWQDAEYWI